MDPTICAAPQIICNDRVGCAETGQTSQSAQFTAKAQAMSMRISQLAGRIQQLTRLAKQTTMYNDNTQQVNNLTAEVKTSLQGLVRLPDQGFSFCRLCNVCFEHSFDYRMKSFKNCKSCPSTRKHLVREAVTPPELFTICVFN